MQSNDYVGSVGQELRDISQLTKRVRADRKNRDALNRPNQEEDIFDLNNYNFIVIVSHLPRILQIALDLMGEAAYA